MTFGLFTNIAQVGSLEHIYIYVPSICGEVLTGPATYGSSNFPSGGTCFLTLTVCHPELEEHTQHIMSLADQYAFGGADHFDPEEVMKVP